MQRFEVERIFEEEKENILEGLHSSDNPVAILLGGQPASGKSRLTTRAQENHPEKDFLIINGDKFRAYHPGYSELVKDVLAYSEKTQIFSNVFTEKLIEEAQKRKLNVIVEGTMRNRDVPLNTAKTFKDARFRVEAYAISAPDLFSEIGIYSRYQKEVDATGSGRLSDIHSHNEAVKGLIFSVNALFHNNAVDKIVIYSFGSEKKIKDYNLDGHDRSWNCHLPPGDVIRQSREMQLNDDLMLSDKIKDGEQTWQSVDKNLKDSVSQVLNKLRLVADNKIINQ
jgi:hypothetical protein